MYLTAHRVYKKKHNICGINAFLHRHEDRGFPEDMREDNWVIDQVANENPGRPIAESLDLVPGGNAVLSFVDIVGREGLAKDRIQYFLDQMERDIEHYFNETGVPITKFESDIAVKFGVTYGLNGNEVREYKALTERAMRLLESPEPPIMMQKAPWIEIICTISDQKRVYSLSPETVEKLKQMHNKFWEPVRVLDGLNYGTEIAFKSLHGGSMNDIATNLTGLTLEQIDAQGGLILYNPATQKKIKWPELKEI